MYNGTFFINFRVFIHIVTILYKKTKKCKISLPVCSINITMTSLADFIRDKREKAGYSIYGLAERAAITIEALEDIESGKELFLSVTTRQKLARVLKCSPTDIKKYEREYEFEIVSEEKIDEIKTMILNRQTNLKCPLCGEPLVTRIARMHDLEDNLVLQPKAHCVKCVFQIKE